MTAPYGTFPHIFGQKGNHKMNREPQSEIKAVALVEMQIGKIFRVVTSTHPVIIMHENNHIQPVWESSAKHHTSHEDGQKSASCKHLSEWRSTPRSSHFVRFHPWTRKLLLEELQQVVLFRLCPRCNPVVTCLCQPSYIPASTNQEKELQHRRLHVQVLHGIREGLPRPAK